MEEVWRSWRNGDYEVSNLGRVRRATPGRRTWPGRLMKPLKMKIGYLQVKPTIEGKNVQTYVHWMVAEVFLGPRPPDTDINHIDGDKTNNVVANLEYVSHAANMQHAGRAGLMVCGEAHSRAKLTEEKVREMRADSEAGVSGRELSERYGVSRGAVSQIVNRQKWKQVA
jgi:hypothetical protein